MPPEQIIVFIFCCLLIGVSKGGLGGPLPVSLVVPALSLVMDATEAVPLVLPFLIFADWFALRVYWRQWNIRYIKLMLPMGVIGVIMGGLLLSAISDTLLQIVIGVFTIVVVVYKILSDRLASMQYKHQKWHAYLASWASGFSSTLANSGGPPFAIYMLLQRVEPIPFIATTTLYFAIINALKIPIFLYRDLIDIPLMLSVWWALPIIPVGVWIGRKALNYVDQVTFERIIIVFLILSAILLFATL